MNPIQQLTEVHLVPVTEAPGKGQVLSYGRPHEGGRLKQDTDAPPHLPGMERGNIPVSQQDAPPINGGQIVERSQKGGFTHPRGPQDGIDTLSLEAVGTVPKNICF